MKYNNPRSNEKIVDFFEKIVTIHSIITHKIMSQKKIIFFIILGIVLLAMIIGFTYIWNQQQHKKKPSASSMKIWITDGTTESYQKLIDGFKKYAPEYARTDIIIKKQSSDSERYRTLLLSTITEWNWPDIFMVKNWEDDILETKIEPIPNEALDFWEFEKRYDDTFRDLVYFTGSWKDKVRYIKWIPLGFETLGVFYNKNLIREIPKTWDELDNLYNDTSTEIYPTNIWLGPTYTPNMVDIYPIWLNKEGIDNYKDVYDRKSTLNTYISYGSLWWGNTQNDWDTESNKIKKTLHDEKKWMIEDKMTTLDLFMQWKISMILGYPSLILELEKSNKRSKEVIDISNILTERIPQAFPQKKQNLGKYTYFAISKHSNNTIASAKFLEYLLTPDAERIFINEYPYLIPAQIEFYATAKKSSLSETFERAKLDSFIPLLEEKISIFHYGIRSQFEKYMKDWLDNSDSPDIVSITKNISIEIACDINSLTGEKQSTDCQSK